MLFVFPSACGCRANSGMLRWYEGDPSSGAQTNVPGDVLLSILRAINSRKLGDYFTGACNDGEDRESPRHYTSSLYIVFLGGGDQFSSERKSLKCCAAYFECFH